MPECPEIAVLASQLRKRLPDKMIAKVVTTQKKSLNIKEDAFHKALKNQIISHVESKGKWIRISFLSGDYLAINLGMGGEIYYNLTHEKMNTQIFFKDGDYLTISFWWFGHVHYVEEGKHHTMDELGLDLIHEDISLEEFTTFILKHRGSIKNVLLDQRKIAGIGNYYIHDILFKAHIHPLSKANELSKQDIKHLYEEIVHTFRAAIKLGGSFYEQDIYANKGLYKADLVAYKEGEACPNCETTIIKIKTNSTTSYLCPKCQLA